MLLKYYLNKHPEGLPSGSFIWLSQEISRSFSGKPPVCLPIEMNWSALHCNTHHCLAEVNTFMHFRVLW